MTSFLSRMANEASAALSDAYGHVVHGDDAGSSAKVVWVVHPTKVPIDIIPNNNNNNLGSDGVVVGGEVGVDGKNKGGGGGETAGSPGRQSSYLFTQKFGECKMKKIVCVFGSCIESIYQNKYTNKYIIFMLYQNADQPMFGTQHNF